MPGNLASKLISALAILLAGSNGAAAFLNQAPPGHTGGFGEPDCTACHFDKAANRGANNLTLEGLPEAYEGGMTYELTISLSDPDMRFAGFLMSARAAGVDPCGGPAGRLVPVDARTERVFHSPPPVEYLRSVASDVEPHSVPTAIWKLLWRAPEVADRYVAFHLAANAANGDESPLGDNIYRLEIILHPAREP